MVPKIIPKNQRPEIIPEPIKFPGMAHLFPNEPERLLCPVRAQGLYIVKSAERAQNDPLEKLFVHFTPATQLFTTHFRRWVAETIRLTYEFFPIRSPEDQGPWRPGYIRIYSLLQKYASEGALRTDRMEVIKRVRPSLSTRHGGRYRTTRHPSGGRTDGFPVLRCLLYPSLATSSNVG